MGKIAQVVLVVAQIVVSILGIFVGADTLPDLITAEGGDQIARGHRAMAILGAMFVGLSILIVPFAIDMFYHRFMDITTIMAVILAALVTPFLVYVPIDRRITRLERERAEAAESSAKES